MLSSNPLLEQGLPKFDEVLPEHVLPALNSAIEAHKVAMSNCAAGTDFRSVVLRKELADAELSTVWQIVSHLNRVANTPEMRAAHQLAEPIISAYTASAEQDQALFRALKSIPRRPLSSEEARALDLTIRGFELSGAGLAPQSRERFSVIRVELAKLSTEFSNAVMDATEAWTLHIVDERRLAGISTSDRASLAAQAQAKGLDGWLIDLHPTSVRAVTNHAEDRELRLAVYQAFNTRASEVGPHAGRYDNSARISRILELRHEAAQLLGFDSPVAMSLATKMACGSGEVEGFLLNLAARAKQKAALEYQELAEYACRNLSINTLEPWDLAYVSEHLRRESHAIDEVLIKRHLPLPRVLDGLFDLVNDLYGVVLRPADNNGTWHPDVQYFGLYQAEATEPFAGIYCDFFARPGKIGGAWMDVCHPRLADANAVQIPIALLNCNFGPGVSGEPAYISHWEMITLFHEMGHCLHHALTEVDFPSIGGIQGVEWDAVELPSQFMENFAWEPDMLRRVSAQAETGACLPDDMIHNMRLARRFLGGLALLRQVEPALFDIRLHLAGSRPGGSSVLEVSRSVQDEIAVAQRPEWHRFPHAFNHVFAGSYASGYYSYLWAERLSTDAFEAFTDEAADRPALGKMFREQVLSRGGTRPAIENFKAFRGREPESDALLRSRGLAA